MQKDSPLLWTSDSIQPVRRVEKSRPAAQEAYAEAGAYPELLSIYHLLGDPSKCSSSVRPLFFFRPA